MSGKLKMAMVGGGPGAFIGEVHRKASRLDGNIELVGGAFDIDPKKSLQMGKELGLDPARVNPNGSGISLGHPVGATGAIITVKLLHELQRSGGRYGLATLCIGGGQGIAAIFERC